MDLSHSLSLSVSLCVSLSLSVIDSCDSYKYLGDTITRNGSNKKNFEERETKVMASTRKILSLCGNAVFRSIRLQALLKMHNCCTMAGFLTNIGEDEIVDRAFEVVCDLWDLSNSKNSLRL